MAPKEAPQPSLLFPGSTFHKPAAMEFSTFEAAPKTTNLGASNSHIRASPSNGFFSAAQPSTAPIFSTTPAVGPGLFGAAPAVPSVLFGAAPPPTAGVFGATRPSTAIAATAPFDPMKPIASFGVATAPTAAKNGSLFSAAAPGGFGSSPTPGLLQSSKPSSYSPFSSTFDKAPVSSQHTDKLTSPSKRKRDSEVREPQKRIKQDYKNIITVVVGQEAEEFVVHRSIICEVSPFFAAACSSKWVEEKTGKVALPAQDPKYFKFYLDWVYNGRFDEKELQDTQCSKEDFDEQATAEWKKTVALCHIISRVAIMAGFLQDTNCKKTCLEILVRHSVPGKSNLMPDTIDFICNNTAVDSGLFRWMVDDLAPDLIQVAKNQASAKSRLSTFPAAVKDAVLLKTICAIDLESKFEPMGTDASKYFDEE